MPSSSRLAKFASALEGAGVAAYFASTKATMGWLAGLGEVGGERLLTLGFSAKGEMRLIAPALAASQAARHGMKDIRPWKDGEDPFLHLRELGRNWDLEGRTVAVDDDGPSFLVFALQECIPGARVILGHELRTEVMAIKEEWELDLMARAGQIADRAFDEVLGQIRPGQTEKEVADLLKASMAAQGGTPSFCIVAAGPASAEPHHDTADDLVQPDSILLMDFGCTVEGYCSDITRTVAVGNPDSEADKVYATVLEAHQAARSTIRPGTAYQEADRAARKVITEAGYGDFFFHRTGHGIGLAIHEAPNVVEGETRPFRPGACFSIEPGIYLEGRFGVRIENIVTATEDGHRSFNAEPPSQLIRL